MAKKRAKSPSAAGMAKKKAKSPPAVGMAKKGAKSPPAAGKSKKKAKSSPATTMAKKRAKPSPAKQANDIVKAIANHITNTSVDSTPLVIPDVSEETYDAVLHKTYGLSEFSVVR